MSWLTKICKEIKSNPFQGHCFQVAAKLADEIRGELVHGKARKEDGTIIEHAWVEKGDLVYDRTVREQPFNRQLYYAKTHARPEARYSALEALVLPVRAGHWGPWTVNEIQKKQQKRK
jgi:hypothetical protein